MVAVHHEVGIPHLVEFDRRQIFCTVERPVYALPLVPHACLLFTVLLPALELCRFLKSRPPVA